MTTKEKANKEKANLFVASFIVLIIMVVVILELQDANKPAATSYPETTSATSIAVGSPEPNTSAGSTEIKTSVNSTEPTRGYGIGETPSIPQPTPSQSDEMRRTARLTGITEQEMEQSRAQLYQYGVSGQATADAAKANSHQ